MRMGDCGVSERECFGSAQSPSRFFQFPPSFLIIFYFLYSFFISTFIFVKRIWKSIKSFTETLYNFKYIYLSLAIKIQRMEMGGIL